MPRFSLINYLKFVPDETNPSRSLRLFLRQWLLLHHSSLPFQRHQFARWEPLNLKLKGALLLLFTLPVVALGLGLAVMSLSTVGAVFGFMGLIGVTLFHYKDQQHTKERSYWHSLWADLVATNHKVLDDIVAGEKQYEHAQEQSQQTIDKLNKSLVHSLHQAHRAEEQVALLTIRTRLIQAVKEGLTVENATLRTLTDEQRIHAKQQAQTIDDLGTELIARKDAIKSANTKERRLLKEKEHHIKEARSLYKQRHYLVAMAHKMQTRVEELTQLSTSLVLSQELLGQRLSSLYAIVKMQETNLLSQQTQICKVVKEHEEANALLATTLQELAAVKKTMAADLIAAHRNQDKLFALNNAFSELISGDAARRALAFKKITSLLDLEESLYGDFAITIEGVSARLTGTTSELEALLMQQAQAQKKAEVMLARMDALTSAVGRALVAKPKPVSSETSLQLVAYSPPLLKVP